MWFELGDNKDVNILVEYVYWFSNNVFVIKGVFVYGMYLFSFGLLGLCFIELYLMYRVVFVINDGWNICFYVY